MTANEPVITSDSEMRFKLLAESRSILFRHWEEKVFVEKATATFEGRAPKVISPPSTRKIMSVALDLYNFVQNTPVAKTSKTSEAEAAPSVE